MRSDIPDKNDRSVDSSIINTLYSRLFAPVLITLLIKKIPKEDSCLSKIRKKLSIYSIFCLKYDTRIKMWFRNNVLSHRAYTTLQS